jgi:hypothetical protein
MPLEKLTLKHTNGITFQPMKDPLKLDYPTKKGFYAI